MRDIRDPTTIGRYLLNRNLTVPITRRADALLNGDVIIPVWEEDRQTVLREWYNEAQEKKKNDSGSNTEV